MNEKADLTPPERLIRALSARPRASVVVTLAAVVLLGLFARAEDLVSWRDHQGLFFSAEDTPLLTNFDGYHYLRLARSYSRGASEGRDELRLYPERPLYPSPTPLLSVVAAWTDTLTGVGLEWAAVLAPVWLAPFVVVPLFLLGRRLGLGRAATCVATLHGVLSLGYLTRTRAGVFDTDCLNLTLALAITWAMAEFALTEGRRRYGFLALACALSGVLAWAWDTGRINVVAIFLLAFVAAVASHYRVERAEAKRFGVGLGVALLSGLVVAGWRAPLDFLAGLAHKVWLVTGLGGGGAYPSTTQVIQEFQRPSWGQLVDGTTGTSLLLVISLLGFGGWARSLGARKAALLAAPCALGALGLLGQRFTMFLLPLTALGLGYWVQALTQGSESSRAEGAESSEGSGAAAKAPAPQRRLVGVGVGVLLAAPTLWLATQGLAGAQVAASLPALRTAAEKTPADAVVWASWDLGYPLMYYAERAVVADGQTLEGDRFVFQNLALASDDPRFAANFMRFYTARGAAGVRRFVGEDVARGLELLKAALAAGPEEAPGVLAKAEGWRPGAAPGEGSPQAWGAFLFPREVPPIYLLLTPRELLSPQWFGFGRWGPRSGSKPSAILKIFRGVERDGDHIRVEGFSLNAKQGGTLNLEVEGERESVPLTHLLTHTGKALDVQDFGVAGPGVRFEWIPSRNYGVLVTTTLAESVWNKLFVRHTVNPAYFRHVTLNAPDHQLWEVRGDGFKAEAAR